MCTACHPRLRSSERDLGHHRVVPVDLLVALAVVPTACQNVKALVLPVYLRAEAGLLRLARGRFCIAHGRFLAGGSGGR